MHVSCSTVRAREERGKGRENFFAWCHYNLSISSVGIWGHPLHLSEMWGTRVQNAQHMPGREGEDSDGLSPAPLKALHMPAGTQSIHVAMARCSQQSPSPSPRCACVTLKRAQQCFCSGMQIRQSISPTHTAGLLRAALGLSSANSIARYYLHISQTLWFISCLTQEQRAVPLFHL